jgi:hypothetical protein
MISKMIRFPVLHIHHPSCPRRTSAALAPAKQKQLESLENEAPKKFLFHTKTLKELKPSLVLNRNASWVKENVARIELNRTYICKYIHIYMYTFIYIYI